MSDTLIATLAGLFVALAWGTTDWLTARSSRHYDTLEINFAVQTISLVWAGIIFAFSGLHVDDGVQVFRIALSSALIVIAYLAFIKALSSGVLGIVVPLGNIYPLFTIVLSLVFLSTHIKLVQLIAMLGITLGAALLAYEKNVKKIPFKEMHKETGLALMAAVIWGVGFFVLNPVVGQVSWQTITIISEPTAFILSFLLLVATRRQQTTAAIKRSWQAKMPLLVGLLGTAGMISLYFGSTRAGSVLIPTVLAAAAPLVTSLFGALFEGERLGVLKRVGAVVVVAGIVALNIV